MELKATAGGIVRNLDPLGRVVLPSEWRRTFDLGPGSPMEILPGTDGSLTIRRYVPTGACIFCGEGGVVRYLAGRPICRTCTTQLITEGVS